MARQMKKELKKQKLINDLKKECLDEKETNESNEELNIIWVNNGHKKPLKEESEHHKVHETIEQPRLNENNDHSHEFRGALERGVIPDAKTIYALKKKRQQARNTPEFISLYDEEIAEEEENNQRSRLVREDDGCSDDDEERISFSVNKEALEREKTKEAFLLAQEEEEENSNKEDSEDEIERWEKEQIRKGIGISTQIGSQQDSSVITDSAFGDSYIDSKMNLGESARIDLEFERPSRKKKVPNIDKLFSVRTTVTLESMRNKIQDKLKILKDSLEKHERELITLNVEIEQINDEIENLQDTPKEVS